MSGLPRVYTIPPGVPFVDALAAQVLRECDGDPLKLSVYTILLPTRRAVRSLREAFLRRAESRALLLPRLTPIGEIDEEVLFFVGEEAAFSEAAFDIPPAIPELRRRLLLAELIRKLPVPDRPRDEVPGDGERTVEQAVQLAAELGRLIDRVEIERIGFEGLAGLVPERYAKHWQITLEFLKIVTEHWPKLLAAEGAIDPTARRNRLLEAQTALWRARPPEHPVIAAGSTGSIPATADLLACIAVLPQGRVVLPGLDRHTDADAWDKLEPSHPQYGLKRLLEHIGLDRRDVQDWPCDDVAATPPPRARLVAEAMRPAGSTDQWRRLASDWIGEALAGLRRIDCPTPREEAGVIALLMRGALEVPGRTAALVTLDRALARRVAVELERWGVEVNDSAGTPLDATPPGAFLRLLASAAAEELAPLPLVALMKHPLAAGGLEPEQFRRRARLLELALLRGPRPAAGIAGLRAALETLDEKYKKDRQILAKLIDRLEAALGPLVTLLQESKVEASRALVAHVAVAEALAASDTESGAVRLWKGDAGEQAAGLVAELSQAAEHFSPIEGGAYPGFFASLLEGLVVRPRYGRHPRLSIWGPLEARLQHADLLILGGLNEGAWPPAPPVDPWMSRPMRAAFGLPEPERRIGLSAHDFAQSCAAREVVLTRSLKVDGVPTVPARWLLRLDNLLRAVNVVPDRSEPVQWLAWQGALDRPSGPPSPVKAPAPTPPLSARPRKLSVTEIETWMRDPYAIYAKHVLRLRALDPLDADPGVAERGSFIHKALELFLKRHPVELPRDAAEQLLALGKQVFGAVLERPGVQAFWWPRFERVVSSFVEIERKRRNILAHSYSESRGTLLLMGPAGPFTLEGRADRIDRLKEGGLAIVDYKTGSRPKPPEVKNGLSPQLPLEAAMAQEGAFHDVPAEVVKELAFWWLSGGDPADVEMKIKEDPASLAREALAGLLRLIAAFDNPETAYPARPRPDYAPRYSDYEHLARVKEWSAVGGKE